MKVGTDLDQNSCPTKIVKTVEHGTVCPTKIVENRGTWNSLSYKNSENRGTRDKVVLQI